MSRTLERQVTMRKALRHRHYNDTETQRQTPGWDRHWCTNILRHCNNDKNPQALVNQRESPPWKNSHLGQVNPSFVTVVILHVVTTSFFFDLRHCCWVVPQGPGPKGDHAGIQCHGRIWVRCNVENNAIVVCDVIWSCVTIVKQDRNDVIGTDVFHMSGVVFVVRPASVDLLTNHCEEKEKQILWQLFWWHCQRARQQQNGWNLSLFLFWQLQCNSSVYCALSRRKFVLPNEREREKERQREREKERQRQRQRQTETETLFLYGNYINCRVNYYMLQAKNYVY